MGERRNGMTFKLLIYKLRGGELFTRNQETTRTHNDQDSVWCTIFDIFVIRWLILIDLSQIDRSALGANRRGFSIPCSSAYRNKFKFQLTLSLSNFNFTTWYTFLIHGLQALVCIILFITCMNIYMHMLLCFDIMYYYFSILYSEKEYALYL